MILGDMVDAMNAHCEAMNFDDWLHSTDASMALCCSYCSYVSDQHWLPSRRDPALLWSCCPRCHRISIWLDGQLTHPPGRDELAAAVHTAVVDHLTRRALNQQSSLVEALSEMRSLLTRLELHVVRTTWFLMQFMAYRQSSRLVPPTNERLPPNQDSPMKGDDRAMADDRVMQAAQADEAGTKKRIEELRHEIELAETRLLEIGEFIRKYREYEAALPEPPRQY